MHHLRSTAVAAALTSALASTLAYAQVHLPLAHAAVPASALDRRGDSTLVGMENWSPYAAYTLNVSVGTPAQTVSVGLSLSTWDTWLPGPSTNLDSIFNSGASSTFEDLQESRGVMTASYADGSSAWGPWGSDTFGIGDVSVDGIFFGVARSVQDTEKGILALGYPVLNSIVSSEDFLSSLASAGEISSSAFSIWADDPQGLTGNILFGAVDTARYWGTLHRVTLRNYYSVYIDTLNATTAASTEQLVRSEDTFKVSVSPSDTVSYLPADTAFRIWEIANATYEPRTGVARIPCGAASESSLTFSFMLGGKYGPTVEVPLGDLILSHDVFPQGARWLDGDGDWCLFGIQNDTRSGLWALGKSIWTRTFLVFDTFNREMAVAPVVYGDSSSSSSSSVVPFSQYGAEIPGSIAPCTASEWACTGSQSTGGYASSESGSRNSPLLIITIIVPIIIGVSVIVGVAGSILCCKRQGLCCFRRNRARDEAIARHAAAAGGAGWAPFMAQNGFSSDGLIATGGPPMQEKFAGGLPPPAAMTAFAPVVAGGLAPPIPQGALRMQQGPMPIPPPSERSVSPMSAFSQPMSPPLTGPLPPPPVVPTPTAPPEGEVEAQTPPPGASRSPKGKGKAVAGEDE